MRILLTTDTVGGVWTFTRELTQQYLSMGHAVALVSFGRAPAEDQTAWCECIAATHGDGFLFRASSVSLEWMQDNATSFTGGVSLLRDVADTFRAHVLHSSEFCWGALPGALPRIVTAHSDVMTWADACRPDGLHSSPWLNQYRALVQSGLERADGLVAPTAWMLGALRLHFRGPVRQSVIANGRSIALGAKATERKLQAVSAGRLWDEAKGIRILTEVDSPMPIFVAGEESFDESAAALHNLHALGPLDENALFQLFRESSVYLATSVYEPFGLAPLEAAMCGCAVVARDLPSLREVWGDAALYFQSAQELSALLHALHRDADALRQAQQSSVARAAGLTAERMAAAYLAVYEEVCGRCRPAAAGGTEQRLHAA